MHRWLFLLVSFPLMLVAEIDLDDLMSAQMQKETGINDLTQEQKCALENWLDANFLLKPSKRKTPLTLAINADNGAKLQLDDGSMYEIKPEDRMHTALWITPFPLEVTLSSNPEYPYKITNLNSMTSVEAMQISKERFLEAKEKKVVNPKPIIPENQEKKAKNEAKK